MKKWACDHCGVEYDDATYAICTRCAENVGGLTRRQAYEHNVLKLIQRTFHRLQGGRA